MKSVFDILDKLESTSGTKAKTEILAAHADNKELCELLDAALNFKHKFYIKKWDTSNYAVVNAASHKKASHQVFLEMLDQLSTRFITGDAARMRVEMFLGTCNDAQRKWYSRVITKDLKCDFGITLCKKAGIEIPEFEVMLAKDGKECKKLDEIVKKGVYLSPKFNGYRCLAVCNAGEVTLYSRNGVEYENFPAVVKSLKELSGNSGTCFVLDGEIMSDDFNAMQQTALSSKSKKSVGDVKYHAFGYISYSEWEAQDFKMPTKDRLACLSAFFENNKKEIKQLGNLVEVKHQLVYRIEDVLNAEKQFLAQGFEGAMILPDIPYYLGKKTNRLMKFKTFLSMDCEVLSIYRGEAGKEFENTMGGMTVLQENDVECNCGSGFDVADRDYMFNNQEEFVGRIAELKYQELTPYKKMQFPIFVRWRNDK